MKRYTLKKKKEKVYLKQHRGQKLNVRGEVQTANTCSEARKQWARKAQRTASGLEETGAELGSIKAEMGTVRQSMPTRLSV